MSMLALNTLAEIVEDTLATKLDIKELETTLQRDMKDLEYRMIIKLGALMVIAVASMATLQQVL